MELTTRHQKTIELLIEGKSHNEISKLIGVSKKALWDWKNNPTFQKEYQLRRKDFFDAFWNGINNVLRGVGVEAVLVLRERMIDKEEKGYVRVQAALGLLNFASHLRNQELETRLEKLEYELDAIAVKETGKTIRQGFTDSEIDEIRAKILGMAE